MPKQAGTLQSFRDVEQDTGGWHPGWRQHHRASDVSTAAPGVSLHTVLRLQTLPRKEDQDQEEEEREEAIRLQRIGETLPYQHL